MPLLQTKVCAPQLKQQIRLVFWVLLLRTEKRDCHISGAGIKWPMFPTVCLHGWAHLTISILALCSHAALSNAKQLVSGRQ